MLIVANWKAYGEHLDKAKRLVLLGKKLSRNGSCSIVLAPPAPFLSILAAKNTSPVSFAVQDISATSGGATTGEMTAPMAVSGGATYAIVGHSERRARGGDTNQIVAEKLAHALAHSLIPILCVGEREHDTEGQYLSFIREEITSALTGLAPRDRGQVIIAYEPLWAIGKTATNAIGAHDLAEMVLYIHKVLAELLPGKSSMQSQVLYGGSVEPGNARDLAATSQIDGFLVGHASVDETTFPLLVRQLSSEA